VGVTEKVWKEKENSHRLKFNIKEIPGKNTAGITIK
jgi:hypothetical protein